MPDLSILVKTIRDTIRGECDRRMPYWATVSTVSGTQVAVTTPDATTTATATIDAAAGTVAVGDTGIVLPIKGGGLVFVPQETTATAYRRIPIEVDTTSPTKATTTNTASYATLITTTVTPSQYGTYGCMVWGSASLWRSVASGDKRLQLAVGGTTHEVVSATAVGSVMTAEHTMITRILRDSAGAMTINAGNPSVTITLGYRGGGTAGTTNIVNAEISGYLYRIS